MKTIVKENKFSVVDIELTEAKEIIQIAILNLNANFEIEATYNFYIKPKGEISPFLTKLTGITNELLKDKYSFDELSTQLYKILSGRVLICHGVAQDYAMLKSQFALCGLKFNPEYFLDSVELSKIFLPTLLSYRLEDISLELGILLEGKFHRADIDVMATYKLLIYIINKINTISEKNYDNIKKYLSIIFDKDNFIVNFVKIFRVNSNKIEKKYEEKIKLSQAIDEDRKIFVTSIDERDFIKKQNDKASNFMVLKSKSSYICDDFYNYFDHSNHKIELLFYMKLLVWYEETKTGDYEELNLDISEKLYLEKLKEKLAHSKENLFYNNLLKKSENKPYIVTNYLDLASILNHKNFNHYTLVFESESILFNEIKNYFKSSIILKEVLKEINLNNINGVLSSIKYNLDCFIKFLYGIYIENNLELWQLSKDSLLDDLKLLRNETKNRQLFLTNKFLSCLEKVITDEKNGNFRFENYTTYHSFILYFYDSKKEKIFLNQIYNRNFYFLNHKQVDTSQLLYQHLCHRNLTPSNEYKQLYIFEYLMHQENMYHIREKKSNIRYKKYGNQTHFKYFYKDLLKNERNAYICYADKSIILYYDYIKELFDEIFYIKDINDIK